MRAGVSGVAGFCAQHRQNIPHVYNTTDMACHSRGQAHVLPTVAVVAGLASGELCAVCARVDTGRAAVDVPGRDTESSAATLAPAIGEPGSGNSSDANFDSPAGRDCGNV